jgi:SAM-dependent methyltransferase
MLKWLRPQAPPQRAALAMIGAKTADCVLIVGAKYPAIAAELALTAGLNGQAVVVARADDRESVEAAAREAGALIDFEVDAAVGLQLAGRIFDLIVWMEPLASRPEAQRLFRMREAFAALRPGGRAVVIEGSLPSGLFPRQPAGPTLESSAVVRLLADSGGLAARNLGTIDGLTYYEARKTR